MHMHTVGSRNPQLYTLNPEPHTLKPLPSRPKPQSPLKYSSIDVPRKKTPPRAFSGGAFSHERGAPLTNEVLP